MLYSRSFNDEATQCISKLGELPTEYNLPYQKSLKKDNSRCITEVIIDNQNIQIP